MFTVENNNKREKNQPDSQHPAISIAHVLEYVSVKKFYMQ